MDLTTYTERQVDEMLEAASHDKAKAESHVAGIIASLHRYIGDKGKTVYITKTRTRTEYALSDVEAVEKARTEGAQRSYDQSAVDRLLASMVEEETNHAAVVKDIKAGNAEFTRRGGWTRFFLVAGGHIHKDMNCSTCNKNGQLTQFGWLPALSGKTEAEAVAEHGAVLCTVCYPSAPVEWTNKYELEQAAKVAAKCPGKRDYNAPSRTGYVYGNWATCDTCGEHVTITSAGNLRSHKPKASA
jgi:hypothetical protein